MYESFFWRLKNQWKLLKIRAKNQPIISYTLVIINLLIYVLCKFIPEIYGSGACGVYEVITNKEYGRIIWSMFLHSDAQHLFNNMVIVFFMGSILETEIGHTPYGIVYFLSGIGGNILSLFYKLISVDWAVSIGASGAVFGLDGLLIAMVLFFRERLNLSGGRVIFVVLLSLYSGFLTSNIDNAAHLGGLLVGFLSGLIVCVFIRIKENKN